MARNNKLPIHSYKETFLNLVREHPVVLVTGETGCGKTTQIPQWCLEYCKKNIKNSNVACTQPRRIAAMTVAARVAKEMNVQLGQVVGYSVRFDTCVSTKTRIRYLTDGMLIREAMFDKSLNQYGVIIIDEAHERTLQTEILFGIINRAMTYRALGSDLPELKVVIMSATINVKLFKKYFNSPTLHIEGRQHPVEDLFAENPQSDLLTATLTCVFQVHRTCPEGDILVFCSGQDEIHSLIKLTKNALKHAPESLQGLVPLPLYATLPAPQQMKVFDRQQEPQTNGASSSNGCNGQGQDDDQELEQTIYDRRVIYATNVAETSVTIPNITYVIDTGKVKCRTFCPKTGIESLKVTTISKAQAKQRSGRAGRVKPGTCYRLFTNEEFTQMPEFMTPEIKRCSLDGIIMQLISCGVEYVGDFEFLERPDDNRIKSALTNLLNLKAIAITSDEKEGQSKTTASSSSGGGDDDDQSAKHQDDNENFTHQKKKARLSLNSGDDSLLSRRYDLTQIGLRIRIFPVSPSMARIIVAANELKCVDEVLTIISLLSIESLFHIPPNKQSQADLVLQKFHTNEGDAIMLLKVYKAFRRASLLNRSGLKQWCVEHFINIKNLKSARKIRKQLSGLCTSFQIHSSSCNQDTSIVRRAMTYGLFNNVATMWDGKYRNKSSSELHIHPSSCLFKARPENILYVELVETNKCYMRNCTLIDMSWVREVKLN